MTRSPFACITVVGRDCQPEDHVTKPAPPRNRKIVLEGLLGIACILIAVVIGGWQYIIYVPPFHPQLPPMPQPNGYEKAERLVVDLSQKIPESVYKRWPDGASTEQLHNQLAPIR